MQYTGTDNRKQRNERTHAPETQKKQMLKTSHSYTNIKPQNSSSVAFYDIQPGNGAGLFL